MNERPVLHDELEDLVTRNPFEPFRIKLVNGDAHDVFYPQNVAIQKFVVHLAPPDQHWVVFPIDKIASVESLIADYQGELARHAPAGTP